MLSVLIRGNGSMTSPVFYSVFSLVVTSITLSLIFFMAWRNFGKEPYALTWSLAFLASTGQWLCLLNAHRFPSVSAHLLAEYAFAVILITLGLRGHCQRTKNKRVPENLWPYALGVYAVIVWHVLIDPHVGIGMAVVPAYAAVTLLVSGLLIIRQREVTRPAEWAAASFILFFAAVQVVGTVISLMQGPTGNEEFLRLHAHFNFMTLPAGYTAMSMFIILMMVSDISAEMKRIATHDQLTGLLNRRGFNEYGKRAFSTARRARTPLSIIMTDIDRFKFINDKYGHASGDAALAHFAKLVSEGRRSEDIIARVGGEEFALLLPGTELRDAMALADQLCANVGATPMDLTGIGLPMTSSFGVAAISKKDVSLDDIVLRADRALYRSKRAGRNQVDLESSQLMLASDGTLQRVPSG